MGIKTAALLTIFKERNYPSHSFVHFLHSKDDEHSTVRLTFDKKAKEGIYRNEIYSVSLIFKTVEVYHTSSSVEYELFL